MHLNIPAHLAELEQRDRLRREAGLPPTNRAYELARLRRLLEAEAEAAWAAWEPDLRCRVEDRLLARKRRRSGDPNWKPAGMLKGLSFENDVRELMVRIYRRRQGRRP
jgi:hypothetical protein